MIHKVNKIYKYLIYKERGAQPSEALSALLHISLDALVNFDSEK